MMRRRAMALVALLATVWLAGEVAAALEVHVATSDRVQPADELPSRQAWRAHEYATLRRCRTELTWADHIASPLIWSYDLPDHADVPGMGVEHGPALERWRFAAGPNRTALRERRDHRHPSTPGVSCTPLTLYTPFCREWIPYSGGAFTEPDLPGSGGHCPSGLTTSNVSTTTAVNTAMGQGCRNIVIAAGVAIGMVSTVCNDCEITIPATSSIAMVVNPYQSGPGNHRVRIRGPGTLGAMQFLPVGSGQTTTSDIIVDGVKMAPNAVSSGSAGPLFSIDTHIDRFVVMNSVAITPATSSGAQGNGWIGSVSDWGIFNTSASTNSTEGPTNSWMIRQTDGSTRRIFADNMFRKYGNQQPIAREGTGTCSNWFMRGNTLVAGDGVVTKDEDPAYDTSDVYWDLNIIVMDGVISSDFAARPGQYSSGGISRKWVMTNTDWRTQSSSNVSASILQTKENACTNPITPPQVCQYRTGNTYTYNATLSAVTPAWPDRTSPLTGVTLNGDPAQLPGAQ